MPIGADGELDRNQHDLVFGYIWLLHGNIKTCMPNLVSYCFFCLLLLFVIAEEISRLACLIRCHIVCYCLSDRRTKVKTI